MKTPPEQFVPTIDFIFVASIVALKAAICTNRMKIIKFIVEYRKHTWFYVQRAST
jgi:hypothetical protein